MTKEELTKYSAHQVRVSPKLFAEFLRLYAEEYGMKPNCAGCSFSSTFSKWKRSTQKTILMKTYDNTFKLNPKYTQLYVPYSGEVITANSPDALVIAFLTQEDGKYFETRKTTFFEKLPNGITEKGKVVEEEIEKEEIEDLKEKRIEAAVEKKEAVKANKKEKKQPNTKK